MKTCDDKSEGKMSIHRPKTMITNFSHILWRKYLKFLYNNCMLLLYVS